MYPSIQTASDFEVLYPNASARATECAMNLVLTADLLVKHIATLLQPLHLTPASGLVLSMLADSESASILSTSPEAGVRCNGWSRVAMRFTNRSAVNTRFIAHSVALGLAVGYNASKSDAIWIDGCIISHLTISLLTNIVRHLII